MTQETQGSPLGGPAHAKRASASRVYTWVACVVAGALGFTLVYANTVIGQIDGSIEGVDVDPIISDLPSPTVTPDPSEGVPLNILLMGSDDRSGENGDIGGRVTDGMRNDTTIIMHISGDRSRVDLVSIPRDAQVEIPDCQLLDGTVIPGTTGDFNIAFSHGGQQGNEAEAAACTINTVQQLTGIPIDHWAVIDFAGFEDMIDALGGVPMCIPEKIRSKNAKLRLEAGPQVLTGKQALGLARMRTAEVGDVSGSDLQRIARQHELLRQVSRVILSKNLLTDAGELTLFLKATASSLTMDKELADTKHLLGLAFGLRNIDPAAIQFHTVPWELTDDYLDVVLLDEAGTMFEQLRGDEPVTAEGDTSAGRTWDSTKETSPKPVPTSTDVTQALLDECAA